MSTTRITATRAQAWEIYDKSEPGGCGGTVSWIERAIIAENALKEIDGLLTGDQPITKLVKEAIRKATHSHGEG